MTAPTLAELKVKLFTDGADKAQIVEMAKQPWIAGFTTNPSLLKKAGVSDYAGYARELVTAVPDRHISFEVFSDDVAEMVAQACHRGLGQECLREIAGNKHAGRAIVRSGAYALARGRQYQHDRDLHR
jgi:Transaldolase/Fructose-6-phosphate aldolase